MVGLRWPVEGGSRRSGVVTPVIMEMKTGDAALASHPTGPEGTDLSPGLAKHVRDIEAFPGAGPGRRDVGPVSSSCAANCSTPSRPSSGSGLPSVPERMRELEITELTERPEVLFVIANHQPKSRRSRTSCSDCRRVSTPTTRSPTVQWMGYALFAENMQPLDEFIKELIARR